MGDKPLIPKQYTDALEVFDGKHAEMVDRWLGFIDSTQTYTGPIAFPTVSEA